MANARVHLNASVLSWQQRAAEQQSSIAAHKKKNHSRITGRTVRKNMMMMTTTVSLAFSGGKSKSQFGAWGGIPRSKNANFEESSKCEKMKIAIARVTYSNRSAYMCT
jgi:hypothetical protein